jgi:hypothetical protein
MSRTNRTNAILMSLMLAFILTLGAGVVVGVAAGRHTPTANVPGQQILVTTRPAEPKAGGWLPDALGLNTEQREKLKAIWTGTVPAPSEKARRSQLIKERDEVLYNLLSDEQKQQYQKEMAEYSAKLADLNKEREKAIQDAVKRTKLILDDKQREKYEQILKDHPYQHGDHDRQPHGGQHEHNGPGRGGPRFMEPRTQPFRGGPATEELKEFGSSATRPG